MEALDYRAFLPRLSPLDRGFFFLTPTCCCQRRTSQLAIHRGGTSQNQCLNYQYYRDAQSCYGAALMSNENWLIDIKKPRHCCRGFLVCSRSQRDWLRVCIYLPGDFRQVYAASGLHHAAHAAHTTHVTAAHCWRVIFG
jgi:hypothetical protein